VFWGERPKNNQQPDKQDIDLAFKSYKHEMTVFLDKENDESSEGEDEDAEEADDINIAQSDVNIPKTADRDYDVLET
jgi:hypothetical protein